MDEATLQELRAGFRFQQDGDFERAADAYRRVLRRDPANEFALNLLGVVCVRSSDYASAVGYLQRAAAVNDGDAETHNNLGLAYKGLHDFEKAKASFERSLEIQPRRVSVLNNLGNVLASQNRHRQAIDCFEAALAVDPGYVDCLGNLCASLLAERKFAAALRAIERAIALAPQQASGLASKGRVLAAMQRYDEAARCLESAIELDPSSVEARIQLSTVLKQLRREEPARAALEHVLQVEPGNAEAHTCMGVLLEQMGDFSGAAMHFRQAIQGCPTYATAYYQLSKLRGERLTDEECRQVRRLLDEETTHVHLRGPLLFAMACELEKQGDYAGSLSCLVEGNRARSNGAVYEPSRDDAYFAAVTASFPAPTPAARRQAADGSFVPIFVLGMPRSGTTLTEQILASHSRIAGAGESGTLSNLALRASALGGATFPQCCRTLSPDDIRTLRAEYLAGIASLVQPAPFVVDKTPMNYQLIGFIMTIFPEARVVFCRRGAIDNCLSIFRLPFDENQSYSHDLASLGRYYRNHERLMAFWLRCYPDAICTAEYESTVDDVERQARRLLAFVGVDFEDSVIRFYDNERMILTPSAQQVRQPIYRSSVEAWRRYGDGLKPLIEALA